MIVSLLFLLTFQSDPQPPEPNLYEFAISLDDAAVYQRELEYLFTSLILEDLNPTDIMIIVDPIRRERKFFIQLSDKFDGKPLKLRQKMLGQLHGAELAQLQMFFADLTSQSDPANQSSEPLFQYLNNAALLNHEFPRYQKHLIFIGNMIAEHDNPLFSLIDRVPSLSHLDHSDSIFATIGKSDMLTGFSLHVIHSPDLNEFSPHQREKHHSLLKNFVATYMQKCGGALHSFTGNVDHLNGLTLGAFEPILALEQITDEPLQSTLFQPMRITEEVYVHADGSEETVTNVQAEEALYQDVSAAQLPAPINLDNPETDTIGFLSIGARWAEPIDLDVYVQIQGDDELSYRNQSSSVYEGIHIRDHTRSPEQNGFETVLFSKNAVDLRKLKPIYINHYSGSPRSTTFEFELRIMFQGRLYWRNFTMNSRSGSGGRGNRDQSSAWVRVDVREIVSQGLRQR